MGDLLKVFGIRSIVAVMIIIMSFGVIFILMWKPVPMENKDLINVSIGFVLGSVSGIVSFYFGSSKAQEGPTADAKTVTQQVTKTEITNP